MSHITKLKNGMYYWPPGGKKPKAKKRHVEEQGTGDGREKTQQKRGGSCFSGKEGIAHEVSRLVASWWCVWRHRCWEEEKFFNFLSISLTREKSQGIGALDIFGSG